MLLTQPDTNRSTQERADGTARALHLIGGTLCRRTAIDVPGLATLYDAHAVIVADGTRLTGPLGSFAGRTWRSDQNTFDKITINTRHISTQDADPHVYAENILTVFLHELTHMVAFHSNLVDTLAPDYLFHTEDFARIARRMGLHVEKSPEHQAGLFTPHLTEAARTRHRDLLTQLTKLRLGGMRGRGLAGPPDFTGSLPDTSSGIFTTTAATAAAFRHPTFTTSQ